MRDSRPGYLDSKPLETQGADRPLGVDGEENVGSGYRLDDQL